LFFFYSWNLYCNQQQRYYANTFEFPNSNLHSSHHRVNWSAEDVHYLCINWASYWLHFDNIKNTTCQHHVYELHISKCSAIWMQISVSCFYFNYNFSSFHGVGHTFKMTSNLLKITVPVLVLTNGFLAGPCQEWKISDQN